MVDDNNNVVLNFEASSQFISSLTLNMYRMTNRMLVVHMTPPAGDANNYRYNIDQGAYSSLSLTLPKVKQKLI